jgi:hypothetical protein
MADNAVKYGFRWSTAYNGGKACPAPEWHKVATGYQASPNSVDVDLNIGDAVIMATGGNINIAQGTDGTPGIIYGVIVAIGKVWDGSKMTSKNFLPGATNWGTVLERRATVGVVPIVAGAWEVDVTGNTSSFDTETEYLNEVGSNCDFTNVSNATTDKANQRLDISTTSASDGQFRIIAVSPTVENRDFSGNFVKLIVAGNEVQNAAFVTAGI